VTNIGCRYLGLALRAPIIASASPLTGRLHNLVALEKAGVGAVVLPSLFEEEIEEESDRLSERLDAGAESTAEATSYLPVRDLHFIGPMAHLRQVAAAKHSLGIPVIASLNGSTPGGWLRYASMLAEAGADALEINLYAVEADPTRSASDVEDANRRLVAQLRRQVSVPFAVKLSPYLSSTANFARRVVEAGADGLVLFNRFMQPDIDIATLGVEPTMPLSHAYDVRLPLRWVALLRPMLPRTSIGLSSGVQSGSEVVKALLAGADVAMSASALLRHGPAYARELVAGLTAWMKANDYRSVEQMRGSLASHGVADPRAYERAQYIGTLIDYRTSLAR
jgi:dihydroorotate dehydrogenase (fumarate)